MLKSIYRISVALLLALCCASCLKDEPQSGKVETGYLYVSLKQDVTVDPVFKSTASEDMTFALVIYDWNDNVVATYDDHRELAASPLELPTGTYACAHRPRQRERRHSTRRSMPARHLSCFAESGSIPLP